MALPKWTEERTAALVEFVGDEAPISQATVQDAAEQLETTNRSISSKLRKMGYEVESSTSAVSRKFSPDQEQTLTTFVTDNSGQFTYAQIAEAFEGGVFTTKQIQGKLMSMQLGEHVKPTPKQAAARSFSEGEEAQFVALASSGAYLEDIAEAMNRSVNQVRGKALSLLRTEAIASIPPQRESKGTSRIDPLEGIDVASMTVEQIAEETGKTPRGVKTMLTHRKLTALNYDGAAKAAKANG